eukprot:CAMPEP_0202692038 /NCGR_PEP_ID=MMETSP1385-20130828/6538_1 /ASSEMBLY_ACC=CAM_ASM_000861 /TAXON_ID=933848 /ORGANISM="Elphidium margaritaceum" /LENGTH=442 /DNA_ID=CAMNT_0049347511 /DNA_START=178 /DNA_END=1504 /DNA_ORIENTATION=+
MSMSTRISATLINNPVKNVLCRYGETCRHGPAQCRFAHYRYDYSIGPNVKLIYDEIGEIKKQLNELKTMLTTSSRVLRVAQTDCTADDDYEQKLEQVGQLETVIPAANERTEDVNKEDQQSTNIPTSYEHVTKKEKHKQKQKERKKKKKKLKKPTPKPTAKKQRRKRKQERKAAELKKLHREARKRMFLKTRCRALELIATDKVADQQSVLAHVIDAETTSFLASTPDEERNSDYHEFAEFEKRAADVKPEALTEQVWIAQGQKSSNCDDDCEQQAAVDQSLVQQQLHDEQPLAHTTAIASECKENEESKMNDSKAQHDHNDDNNEEDVNIASEVDTSPLSTVHESQSDICGNDCKQAAADHQCVQQQLHGSQKCAHTIAIVAECKENEKESNIDLKVQHEHNVEQRQCQEQFADESRCDNEVTSAEIKRVTRERKRKEMNW